MMIPRVVCMIHGSLGDLDFPGLKCWDFNCIFLYAQLTTLGHSSIARQCWWPAHNPCFEWSQNVATADAIQSAAIDACLGLDLQCQYRPWSGYRLNLCDRNLGTLFRGEISQLGDILGMCGCVCLGLTETQLLHQPVLAPADTQLRLLWTCRSSILYTSHVHPEPTVLSATLCRSTNAFTPTETVLSNMVCKRSKPTNFVTTILVRLYGPTLSSSRNMFTPSALKSRVENSQWTAIHQGHLHQGTALHRAALFLHHTIHRILKIRPTW